MNSRKHDEYLILVPGNDIWNKKIVRNLKSVPHQSRVR